VTELEPDNPTGHENLGVAYFSQGRWEECIPAFQKALSIQPHWSTYSNLGTAYFFLRRYADAVQAFQKATELNRNDAVTLGNLADALRWSGQRDRAGEAYARAIAAAYDELQVNPKDALTLGVIALYYAKTGDAAQATTFIGRARRIDAANVSLIYYEAVVHTLAGRTAQALASLGKALEGGYPAREVAADPELQPLTDSQEWSRLLKRFQAAGTS
jgi:tetratricopeptide (TPR) repeat protein